MTSSAAPPQTHREMLDQADEGIDSEALGDAPYVAPVWARNPHLQTLWPVFFRSNVPLRWWPERLTLPDGDFVDLAWNHRPDKLPEGRPVVVIFHGLEGGVESPYVRALLNVTRDAGFIGVLMHFRGCSGELNRGPRGYHSGETEDPRFFLEWLQRRLPDAPIGAAGFSLGGNVLTKMLGEDKDDSPLRCAVVVSAPLRLNRCIARLQTGFSRVYDRHLVSTLRQKYTRWAALGRFKEGSGLTPERVARIKGLHEFDELVTCALHGFEDAEDYYTRSSGAQYLIHIRRPTRIIHALDDPFMTPSVAPTPDETSVHVELDISAHGGHVGFVQGTPWRPRFWLEWRILNFLKRHLAPLAATVLVATMLSACPKPPPIPRYSSAPTADGDANAPQGERRAPMWNVPMAASLEEVRLHAFDDCVFITATREAAEGVERVQLCVDPVKGEVRWDHSVAVAIRSQSQEHYLMLPEHFIYADTTRIVALKRATGEVAWERPSTDGMSLYSIFKADDGQLAVSYGNQELVILNADDGQWIRGFALEDAAIKHVTKLGDKTLALVIKVPQSAQQDQAQLSALDIGQGGAASRQDALTAPTAVWTTPISHWGGEVHQAEQTLLGEFVEAELWALSLADGKPLWHRLKSELGDKTHFIDDQLILSKRQEPGPQTNPGAQPVLQISAFAPDKAPDDAPRWSLSYEGSGVLLGFEDRTTRGHALGATPEHFFIFKSATGEVLWEHVFDRKAEPELWTNASANDAALFLYFERANKEATLRRVPIIRPEGAPPSR